MLDICPFISESDSSVVESSLRNPWIGGSNPGGNYTSFSVSRRMNPFTSENCSFCTLNALQFPSRIIPIHVIVVNTLGAL